MIWQCMHHGMIERNVVSMIKHIVFWNFKDSFNGMDKNQIISKLKYDLEALVGVVPGLLRAEVGIGINPNGYECCLYSELESPEALAVYQSHPAHMKVKDFVASVATARAVCDFEV